MINTLTSRLCFGFAFYFPLARLSSSARALAPPHKRMLRSPHDSLRPMQCELLGLPMKARHSPHAHGRALSRRLCWCVIVAAAPEHAKDNQQQKRRQTVSRVTRLTTHVALVSPDRATSSTNNSSLKFFTFLLPPFRFISKFCFPFRSRSVVVFH